LFLNVGGRLATVSLSCWLGYSLFVELTFRKIILANVAIT
jgi:hypothetical protein